MKDKAVNQLMNKLVMSNRTGSMVYLREPLKPSTKSSFVRHIALYNALPVKIKTAKISTIKRRLKKEKAVFNG